MFHILVSFSLYEKDSRQEVIGNTMMSAIKMYFTINELDCPWFKMLKFKAF